MSNESKTDMKQGVLRAWRAHVDKDSGVWGVGGVVHASCFLKSFDRHFLVSVLVGN